MKSFLPSDNLDFFGRRYKNLKLGVAVEAEKEEERKDDGFRDRETNGRSMI